MSATVLISQTTSRRSKGLFPEPRWQRQSGVILGAERTVRFDAEALQHRDDLACVLRRVPGAALHHVVQRLLAIVGLDLRARRAIAVAAPPRIEPFCHPAAIGANVLDPRYARRRRR